MERVGNEQMDGVVDKLDESYEFVERPVYEVEFYPVQTSSSAQHAWLQLLKVISQCANPKLPQIVCLRLAVVRTSRLLQVWKFPRTPFAINALLVQANAGKEDQMVTRNRLWDRDTFGRAFAPPGSLPTDVDALHNFFNHQQWGAISPAHLINLYCKHFELNNTWRFVVACLTEIPSCFAVALSRGSEQLERILSLIAEDPHQAKIRGYNGHLPLHRVFAYVKEEEGGGERNVADNGPQHFRPLFSPSDRATLCERLLEVYPESSCLFTNASSFLCGDDGFAPIHLECRLGPHASGRVIRLLSDAWLGYFAQDTPSLMVQMRCQQIAPSFWNWLWKELTMLHCGNTASLIVEEMDDSPQVLERLVELGCLNVDAANALRESFDIFSSLPTTDARRTPFAIEASRTNIVMGSYLQFPTLDGFVTSLRPEVRADPQAVAFFELDPQVQLLVLQLAKIFRVYWRPHHISHRVEMNFQLDDAASSEVDTPLIQLEDYRKVAGNKGEAVLEALLEAAQVPKCTYRTEVEQLSNQQLRLEGGLAGGANSCSAFRTPDFLFSSPITIQGIEQPVSWIDAKSGWVVPFLTPLQHLAAIVEQMLAYQLLFCESSERPTCGLIFWRYSAVPHLLSIVPKGVYVATSDYCFEFGELNFAGSSNPPLSGNDTSLGAQKLAGLGATEGTWDLSYTKVLPVGTVGSMRENKPHAHRELRRLIADRLFEVFPRGTSFAPYPQPRPPAPQYFSRQPF